MSISVGTISPSTISSNSNINIKKVEFIDGNRLEVLKRKAFETLARDPIVAYGSILNKIESRIYSVQPESLLRTNIQKYLREENLYLVEVNDTYRFRPDLIAQIFYGSNEYFHYVLMVNNMKSFLEFTPDNFNNLIFVFKPEIIASI